MIELLEERHLFVGDEMTLAIVDAELDLASNEHLRAFHDHVDPQVLVADESPSDPAGFYIPPHQFRSIVTGLVTESSTQSPLDIAVGYLTAHAADFGLATDDLEHFRVTNQYESRHTGVTHIYLRQVYRGLDVINADINVNVGPDGRVLSAGSSFVPGLNASPLLTRKGINTPVEEILPSLSPTQALVALSDHFHWTHFDSEQLTNDSLAQVRRSTYLPASGVSVEPIPATLRYVPTADGGVELAWGLSVQTVDGQHWYDASVNAEHGELLYLTDWISRIAYEVYPLPLESPDIGSRSIQVDPPDAIASPLGWHDTHVAVGLGEFSDTRGNNVFAQEDRNANNSGGFRPDGGAELEFDFPIDLTGEPIDYESAAITNLFYMANVLHDIHFRYGFDEAAGNFQETNFSGLGLGGDAIQADALDGADVNMATFSSTPDGTAARMQFHEWHLPLTVKVQAPASLVGDLTTSPATFGVPFDSTSVTGNVVVSDPVDGCATLANPSEIAGNIALIERGDCFFVDKVHNAQDAGATAVIITNNVPEGTVTMGGTNPDITIPSLMISLDDGDRLRDSDGESVNVIFVGVPNRASSLDNTIIIHEYGHGISNRLTGGPATVSALDAIQSGGLGEGWSDWWALMLTQKPSDTKLGAYSIATYVTGQNPGDPGIRRFPFSFDMTVNPLTYADIDDAQANVPCDGDCSEVHRAGEIWSSVLWDLNWLLVDGDGASIPTQGFDADLYNGTGGNNISLQLVMDGLKLQPSNPSFIDARDAILTADLTLTGGANQLAIWTAFARRGMGFSARDGGHSNSVSVTEAFDLPQLVGDAQWDGDAQIVNVGDGTSWSNPDNWTVNGASDVSPSIGPPGDDVTFNVGSTVQTVDLGIDRTVSSITFGANYTLQGSTLSISNGDVIVSPHVVANIDADLTSDVDLTKLGDGTLVISGTAKDIVVDTGTLVLASTATVQNLTVRNGATAILNAPVLGDLVTNGRVELGGDSNGNGALNVTDIDFLFSQIPASVPQVYPRFDLVADNLVDHQDVNELVRNMMRREFGAADLDGDTDISDFNIIAYNLDPLGYSSHDVPYRHTARMPLAPLFWESHQEGFGSGPLFLAKDGPWSALGRE